MKSKLTLITAVIAAAIMTASSALALTFTLQPKEDNTLLSDWPISSGTSPWLIASTSSSNEAQIVLKFDYSSLPAGFQIETATLRLFQTNMASVDPAQLFFYKADGNWSESSSYVDFWQNVVRVEQILTTSTVYNSVVTIPGLAATTQYQLTHPEQNFLLMNKGSVGLTAWSNNGTLPPEMIITGHVVPEPSTALLVLGGLGLPLLLQRRRVTT